MIVTQRFPRPLAALVLLAAACAPKPSVPVETPTSTTVDTTATGLRLVDNNGSWFVTGLSDDAASIIEQGRLFAAQQPIDGTQDLRSVAVLKALGQAVGHSVEVAPQCVMPKATLNDAMRVKPLASLTEEKVGPCLARVISTGKSERGEDYVILNVGNGVGVEPGDQYILLGKAVTADGHTPLGLDTDRDGLCQIPADPMDLKPSTARCIIVKNPEGRKELVNTFAAWMPR